jgi:CheY-like chemotaxis protein
MCTKQTIGDLLPRVLVAEDKLALARMLRPRLRAAGLHVTGTAPSPEASRVLERDPAVPVMLARRAAK